jgi:hypothetical protein
MLFTVNEMFSLSGMVKYIYTIFSTKKTSLYKLVDLFFSMILCKNLLNDFRFNVF